MSIKLRDLILKVRGCKTAAEERALIAKECALIRTSFKDSNLAISDYYRPRNLLKLLYIHLRSVNNNGKYPPVAHFGQLESIKLIAKNYFYQKRVGYLSLSVLMSNDTSLMTLVTNSVSLDLQKPLSSGGIFSNEKYGEAELCACLALNCIGNVSNSEMVLNLARTIHKVLKSKRTYLQNKALLCTRKVLSQDQDLCSDFYDILLKLFQTNYKNAENASILANCMTVFTTILENKNMENKILTSLTESVLPMTIELLTKLVTRSFGSTNQGVYEPFLQERLLKFFSRLSKRVDITNSVATTLILVLEDTPVAKGMGIAVKYECVRCIHTMVAHKSSLSEIEKSIDDMATNMLLDLLVVEDSKDGSSNNQILISLRSINRLLQQNHGRYKKTFSSYEDKFTSYLKNSDSSLVKASLDLIFTLLNESNSEKLCEKVVRYAVKTRATKSHKEFICDRLLRFFKFETNQKNLLELKVRMLLRVLYSCQDEVPQYAPNFFVNIGLIIKDSLLQDLLIFLSLLCHELAVSAKIREHTMFVKAFLCLFALKGEALNGLFGRTSMELYDDCRRRNPSFPKFQVTNSSEIFNASLLKVLFQKILSAKGVNTETRSLVLPAQVRLAKLLNNMDGVKSELKYYARSADVEMKIQSRDLLTLVEKGKVSEFEYNSKPDLDAFAVEVVRKAPEEIVYGRVEISNEADKEDDLLALDSINAEQPKMAPEEDGIDFFGNSFDNSTKATKLESLEKGKEKDFDPFADLAGAM